jgi:hypothetical protein
MPIYRILFLLIYLGYGPRYISLSQGGILNIPSVIMAEPPHRKRSDEGSGTQQEHDLDMAADI